MTIEYDDSGKLILNHIYNHADPSRYFSTLSELDYSIPGEAAPVFRKVIEAKRTMSETDEVNVLDLGCSYGVNAAILKHGLSMDELYQRYAGDDMIALAADEMIERDRTFYADNIADPDLTVTGVDVAENAIEYAVQARMLDDGLTTNLETDPVPSDATDAVGGADIVISTGCVGYVRESTFENILGTANGDEPWMAHFVLRMFPYDEFEELLAERGYVTETLPGTFLQRRFASTAERDHVLGNLADLSIDPAGKEDEGWYHANFYLSRPAAAAEALPLHKLVAN